VICDYPEDGSIFVRKCHKRQDCCDSWSELNTNNDEIGPRSRQRRLSHPAQAVSFGPGTNNFFFPLFCSASISFCKPDSIEIARLFRTKPNPALSPAGHAKVSEKCQKTAGCYECAVHGSWPRIASKPGSSPPERPGLDNTARQPWSDATCSCTTCSSAYFRFGTLFLFE